MALSFWLTAGKTCSRSLSNRCTVFGADAGRRAGTLARRCQSTAAAVQEETPKNVDSQAADAPLPFESLKDELHPNTLRALTAHPFKLTTMTPVQAAVLPLTPTLVRSHKDAEGHPRDLLVRAKTGTGKTLAFLIPAVEGRLRAIEDHVDKVIRDQGHKNTPDVRRRIAKVFARNDAGILVISPTRELATQIATEAQRLTTHHNDMEVQLFVGGEGKRKQMRDWMKLPRDTVVATPGRLRDLIENEPDVAKGLSKVRTLILDECDTLLDMGFRDDLDAIVEALPPTPERQTLLFSATINRAVQQTARRLLAKDFISIDTVSADDSPVHAHIPQYHTVLPSAKEQLPHLLRLIAHDQLANPGKSKIMVFCSTTKHTKLLTSQLLDLKAGLPVKEMKIYEIHSRKDQGVRTRTSDAFRKDTSPSSILVSSDVSARGVDYPGVTRVIQLGIPSSTDQYVHRVGRTGRAGSRGRGDLVLLPWEVGFVSWQLTEISLKPVTTTELESQVLALAEKHDADPNAFVADAPVRPEAFRNPLVPLIKNIPAHVQEVQRHVDTNEVEETFASVLGYYASRDGDLRVSKSVILEGLKDWATQACGLGVPPFLTDSFLAKLGYRPGGSGSSKSDSFRSSSSSRGRGGGSKPSWEKRGSSKSWEQDDRPRSRSYGNDRTDRSDRSDRRYGSDRSERPSYRSERSDRDRPYRSNRSDRSDGEGFKLRRASQDRDYDYN
ncbi:DEAD-domain-containing protein [Gloeophyllum trabeum ATCC 11539]|uniref:ATP-dependent RNA helicase n=1 Tax=Gloeophyllum trabeum (strain ATCC 11539 / FP-39264 / Madison 617) TaxID=670483 RepID=S7RLX1_GLOTA|nr:DEAD-domain-containing protein [Gloeophyllum trabeum ATCC 11539]EPQ53699.1 DEAD-domain-containing protein [Gloeophyllum trabeum ATCC 11539]